METNWYKQYWTGNLLVKKNGKDIDIKKIGEWRQTSKDDRNFIQLPSLTSLGTCGRKNFRR